MAEEPEIRTIDGHQIDLSGGRLVWAGECDDSWYIRFNDGQGNERRLRISYEAANALMSLLMAKTRSDAVQEIYRYVLTATDELGKFKWEVVDPLAPCPQGSEEANG